MSFFIARARRFLIGGLCVTLNLSERRVSSSPLNPLVEMDLRPTNGVARHANNEKTSEA
jgi:hypothetical protein